MTRVSVVMPAYQAESTIGAAVSSVLDQSYRDFELVVVNDGSTDATAAIVEAHPGPIRVVAQANAGVAAARNRGIAEAAGELIAFCDADDYLFPDHLAALVAAFDAGGTGIATANSFWLLPGGIARSKTRYRGRFPRPDEQRLAILQQNFVSTMALFPRALAADLGGFDERKRRAEDWDFWLRAVFAGARVTLQPRPLALYRWRNDSLSSDWRRMDAEVESVLDGLEQQLRLTDEELAYLRRRRAGPGPRQLSRDGDEALRAGRYGEAARLYREAAELCPSERALVWKANTLRAAPPVLGPLLRRRQLSREQRLGLGPDFVR